MTTMGTATKRRRRQPRFLGPLAAMFLLAGSLAGTALAAAGSRQAARTRTSVERGTARAQHGTRSHYRSHHSSRNYRGYRTYRHYRHYGVGYPYFSYYGPHHSSYYHYSPYSSGYGYGPYVLGRGRYASGEGKGALDLDVRPEKAEVYLDGNRLGIADNFDGFPEFLWLPKGTYDLVIYKEGYKTLARQMTIYPGVVIDIEDRMEAGESVRPEDLVSKSTVNRERRERRERQRQATAEPRRGAARPVGRLLLDIRPADAAIYLDGHFLGIADELAGLSAGLVVEPGEHRLEVVRPGYATQRQLVTIAEEGNLEVELQLESR